jgi:hypothetical protein
MAKAKPTSNDRKASAYIRRLQKAEDRDKAARRRKLLNAVSRAVFHLNGYEMECIERVAWLAIGRAEFADK